MSHRPVRQTRSRGWIGGLDAYAFCRHEEVNASLPACWDATSDTVAAAAALKLTASELILLKSSAVAEGLLDPVFPLLVAKAPFLVRVLNFRY